MMSLRQQTRLTVVVNLAIVILANNLTYSHAKSTSANNIYAQRPPINSNPPPPPPDTGAPDQQRDSGTRNPPCEKTEIDLKPLLPVIEGDYNYSGFTLRERPTFWFYVPYKTESVSGGEFVLEDKAGNLVNHLRFKLPKTPGFVSVNIPTQGKPLEKNKQYIWRFVVYCASQPSTEPSFEMREGLVERVDVAALETQLEKAKLEERIQLYANQRIWYDLTTDLVNIHNRPQAWLNLLRTMGLEQLDREAIAGEVVLIQK